MTDIEQRSPEWFAARRGKVTASRVGDIMNTLKNGNWAASRKNYAAQLVTERLTGKDPEPITNEYIEWGNEQEPAARNEYSSRTGLLVEEVGFIDHPSLAMAGASPDGLVGDDGLVEIKCPTTATHIDTLLNETVKEQYEYQMYWQMICTGRRWCDFVSYDPRLPPEMRLFIKRYDLDEDTAKHIEEEVKHFLDDVAKTTTELTNKYREPDGEKENW